MKITSVSIKEIVKAIPDTMFNIDKSYSGYPRVVRYVESDRSITVFADVNNGEKLFMSKGHVSKFVSILN